MNFHILDEKIKEYKNYRTIAEYFFENDIDAIDIINENFFSNLGKNISNWWGGFRGKAYDVDSVVKLLTRAAEFLNDNEEHKNTYKNEIEELVKVINDIKSKSESVPKQPGPRIKVVCPHCGTRMTAPIKLSGTTANCLKCGESFFIGEKQKQFPFMNEPKPTGQERQKQLSFMHVN